jgi:hypothetical protein
LAVADPNRKSGDIPDVGVETAPAGEIEARLVPDASDNIALDCARLQRVSAVRTPVVYRVYRAIMVKHRDRVVLTGNDHTTAPL